MKKIVFVIMFMLMVMLSGCVSIRQYEDIIKSGQLIVATSCDYAPYEFIDPSKKADEKYLGADIEFAKYVASQLELELVIQNVSFELVLGEIQLGTSDIAISGFTYKEDRVGNYAISKSYYDAGEGSQGILLRKEDFTSGKYTNLSDLNKKGVKIAAQNSSVQYDCAKEQLPEASIEKFDLISMGKIDLDNKNVDGIVMAQKVAEILLQTNPDKYIFINDCITLNNSYEGFYVLANVQNQELISKINAIIENMDSNLYESWYNQATAKAIELGQF